MQEFHYFHDFTNIVLLFIIRFIGYMVVSILSNTITYKRLVHGQIIECIGATLPQFILIFGLPSLAFLCSMEDVPSPNLTAQAVGNWHWEYDQIDFWANGKVATLHDFHYSGHSVNSSHCYIVNRVIRSDASASIKDLFASLKLECEPSNFSPNPGGPVTPPEIMFTIHNSPGVSPPGAGPSEGSLVAVLGAEMPAEESQDPNETLNRTIVLRDHGSPERRFELREPGESEDSYTQRLIKAHHPKLVLDTHEGLKDLFKVSSEEESD